MLANIALVAFQGKGVDGEKTKTVKQNRDFGD